MGRKDKSAGYPKDLDRILVSKIADVLIMPEVAMFRKLPCSSTNQVRDIAQHVVIYSW